MRKYLMFGIFLIIGFISNGYSYTGIPIWQDADYSVYESTITVSSTTYTSISARSSRVELDVVAMTDDGVTSTTVPWYSFSQPTVITTVSGFRMTIDQVLSVTYKGIIYLRGAAGQSAIKLRYKEWYK